MAADKLRVSLCDDDRNFRTLLRAVIDSQNDMGVVSESCDGQICVRQVADARPDVVILDLDMPTMSGYQALDEFAAMRLPTKVIVLSGEVGEQVEQAVQDKGAIAFIEKGSADLVASLAGRIRSALRASA
jgi:DNA-binding NarL/FixJ family response regulator